MRLIRVTGGGLITAVVVAMGAQSEPAFSRATTNQLRGPRAQRVTIVRDNYGVPHVYAKDAAGAEFGFGYAQAEDQGPFILTQYRIAMGRDAETFGPSC